MKLAPLSRRLPAALALLGAAGLALPAGAAGPQVGVNAAIRNSVQMKQASDASFRPAVVREAVHIGDAVTSGPNSALQVLLLDRSIFTVGANARMTIDRFVYDPNRGASDVAASVARGSFRFMSGRSLSGQGRSAITTPVASIGVRGTIVSGVVGPDAAAVLAGQPGAPSVGDAEGAILVVLEGPGHDSQGLDKPGAIDVTSGGVTVSVDQPGTAVLILPGQPPLVFQLSDGAATQLASLLAGGPPGPSSGGLIAGPVEGPAGSIGAVYGAPGGTYVSGGSMELPESRGKPVTGCQDPKSC